MTEGGGLVGVLADLEGSRFLVAGAWPQRRAVTEKCSSRLSGYDQVQHQSGAMTRGSRKGFPTCLGVITYIYKT